MKNKFLTLVAAAGLVSATAGVAQAGSTHVSLNIGAPRAVYAAPRPVYVAPRPVYYQPVAAAPYPYYGYNTAYYYNGRDRHRNYDWHYWNDRNRHDKRWHGHR